MAHKPDGLSGEKVQDVLGKLMPENRGQILGRST